LLERVMASQGQTLKLPALPDAGEGLDASLDASLATQTRRSRGFAPCSPTMIGGCCRRPPAVSPSGVAGDFADELLLGGQRVIPNKALSSGFVFRHETLRSAFEAIL
jgi:Domain of unknown function (DUF1731)